MTRSERNAYDRLLDLAVAERAFSKARGRMMVVSRWAAVKPDEWPPSELERVKKEYEAAKADLDALRMTLV